MNDIVTQTEKHFEKKYEDVFSVTSFFIFRCWRWAYYMQVSTGGAAIMNLNNSEILFHLAQCNEISHGTFVSCRFPKKKFQADCAEESVKKLLCAGFSIFLLVGRVSLELTRNFSSKNKNQITLAAKITEKPEQKSLTWAGGVWHGPLMMFWKQTRIIAFDP